MTSYGRRSPALGLGGMVASDQPLATAAGLEMLGIGGSAADVAVAADAVLGVVQPMSTGLGGDAAWIAGCTGSLAAYQGTGAAAAGLDPEPLLAAGALSPEDPRLVVVPGVVDAWAQLLEAHGRLGLDRVLQPAISLARQGAPLSPVAAAAWHRFMARLHGEGATRTFLRDGVAPQAFERFANPALADALELIAAKGPAAFYTGELADGIVAAVRIARGALSTDDLASHRGRVVVPITGLVGRCRIVELGAPHGGVVPLLAAALVDRVRSRYDGELGVADLTIRATDRAFEAAFAVVADPDGAGGAATRAIDDLLSARQVATMAEGLRDRRSKPRHDRAGGTVVVAAADRDGLMVSWASSLFQGFGSGICPPGLGSCLNDRGLGFTAVAGHPNAPAPRKRPYHTVLPAMLLDAGDRPFAAFGFAGADMQPQAQLQFVEHVLAGPLDPQAALDRPRWHTKGGMCVELEPGWPSGSAAALQRSGFEATEAGGAVFGRGSAVVADEAGWLRGAADRRGDGLAAGLST